MLSAIWHATKEPSLKRCIMRRPVYTVGQISKICNPSKSVPLLNSAVDLDPYVFGPIGSGSVIVLRILIRHCFTDPDPSIMKQKKYLKNLVSTVS
jgi:hypothetical protein